MGRHGGKPRRDGTKGSHGGKEGKLLYKFALMENTQSKTKRGKITGGRQLAVNVDPLSIPFGQA